MQLYGEIIMYQMHYNKHFTTSDEAKLDIEEEKRVKVWRGVIKQALVDALSQSKRQRSQTIKKRAIEWISEGGDDFITICEFANLNYQSVQNNLLLYISLGREAKLDMAKQLQILDL